MSVTETLLLHERRKGAIGAGKSLVVEKGLIEHARFDFASWNVARAIGLLREAKERGIKGVGSHDLQSCPIAKAYRVGAKGEWSLLNYAERARLEAEGWDQETYNTFIEWYDAADFEYAPQVRRIREEALSRLLKA